MLTLISDIGSTKSSWALISDSSVETFESLGFNPNYQSENEIENILKNVIACFGVNNIDNIHLYGAGIEGEISKQKLESCIKNTFNKVGNLSLENDLLAAARCSFSDDEDGVIGILGTGSNVKEYINGSLSGESHSLGYILGDEGGGVGFGRYVCKSFVYNDLPKEISSLLQELNFSKDSIIDSIYNKPYPQKYLAHFAKILFPYKDETIVNSLLSQNFNDFIVSHLLKIENIQNKELKFVGSMAFYFQDILKETASKHNLTISDIQQNPLNGLIEYHKKHI